MIRRSFPRFGKIPYICGVMKIERNKTSTAERVAIFALVAGIIDEWKTAYIIARGDDPENLPKTWETSASQWKNSDKIQRLYKETETLYKARFVESYNKGKADGIQEGKSYAESDQNGDGIGTDYTKPENQRKLLNKIIQKNPTSTDALDALKVIIAGQKGERDAGKDKQIQRFYTPLRCSSCPIKAAFAKIKGENNNL